LFAQFAGGSGTEADPYQVATAEHLNNVRNYLGSSYNYIQTADIDLGVSPWNQGEGWQPIGTYSSNTFYGHYDGGSYVVSNLFINRPELNYLGLFGCSGGAITNLGVTNVNVTGDSNVGGLVGLQRGGTISNCYCAGSVTGSSTVGGLVGGSNGSISNCYSTGSVTGGNNTGGLVGGSNRSISNCYSTGSVTGQSSVGGLVGYSGEYGSISDCYSTGSVTGGGGLVGGLVGNLRSGSISNCYCTGYVIGGNNYTGGLVGCSDGSISKCYSTGSVTGGNETGGLVGYILQNGSISNSYCTGSVTGRGNTGGLVGYNIYGSIGNCYCTGSVTGGSYTGGLVGRNYSGNISNCYSTGSVTGRGNTGGLVGYSEGSISNSYWDISRSGQMYSAGGEGRHTIKMIYPHGANTYLGWDWRIWKPDIDHSLNEGYPYFRDMDETPSQAPETAVCAYPLDQAVSVLPDLILQWNAGFSPTNADPPSGYKLWLGTDNPPGNVCAGLDLGYQVNYDPSPDLELNGTYYWKIVPYNAVGEAQNCPVWSFTTYHPNCPIIYPNGGELWQSGTTRTILWSDNASPQAELSISFDNGSQWIAIAEVEGAKGYYHYQVPAVNSTNCKIKLVNLLDGSQVDTSDASFSISSSSSRPKVLLSYPSAANTHLKVGDSVNLSWTRQNVSAVALDYSTDDGQTWTEIAGNLEADTCLWTVPDNPSTDCRVRVRGQADSGVLDISDNAFSIGRIQLLSPNGGEVITGDYSGYSSYPITWSAAGVAYVNIDYSADGGACWSTITSDFDGSLGTYFWNLPGEPTSNGLIRVSNAANGAINDVSDAPFSIRNPIKLTNANGGGFITNSSMFNIRWKMQDISPTAQIYWEYSLDNDTWTRINTTAVSVSNESMYWFVNTGLDDSVWLRAVEQGTNRIVGRSEAQFRVTDKILQLFEPNGGEEYAALTTQTISWDHDGLTNLSIHFSADDGVTWSQLAANVPASELSYSWIVPETPSVNCRIKLQDQTYSYMVLESDLPFTVTPLQIIDPTVDFSADILSGDIPLAVQFTEEVNPGVGNVASRLWDFGDGNTSGQENPLHTYTVAGTYTVSLTITNDFEGTTTETKTDYIVALPNTPRIELLSASSLNYGVVYLGDTSPAQTVEVKNSGTAPLTISSVSFHEASSQFALAENNLPLVVPVDGTAELQIVFIPTTNATVSDRLYINSDASNDPDLAVRLAGTGEYVPPAAVEGVEVAIVGTDAVITWLPVTETIYGTPITPDRYVVLYNETPYEDDHFYYYLDNTTELSYAHHDVALFRDAMFYRVVAVKFYRDAEAGILASLRSLEKPVTWGNLKGLLSNAGRRTKD